MLPPCFQAPVVGVVRSMTIASLVLVASCTVPGYRRVSSATVIETARSPKTYQALERDQEAAPLADKQLRESEARLEALKPGAQSGDIFAERSSLLSEGERAELTRCFDEECAQAKSATPQESEARIKELQAEREAAHAKLRRAEEAQETLKEVDEIRPGEALSSESLFLSVEPLVAFNSDFDSIAIAALGVNWRCWKNSSWAVQAVFGGALNPQEAHHSIALRSIRNKS